MPVGFVFCEPVYDSLLLVLAAIFWLQSWYVVSHLQ